VVEIITGLGYALMLEIYPQEKPDVTLFVNRVCFPLADVPALVSPFLQSKIGAVPQFSGQHLVDINHSCSGRLSCTLHVR